MNKFILITIIALLTLSCSDKAEEALVIDENKTEQVDTSQTNDSSAEVAPQQFKEKSFREKFYESGEQKKGSNSIPLFAYFLIFINFIATLFAIFFAFQVYGKLQKNEKLFNQRIDNRKKDIASLKAYIEKLEQEIGRKRLQKGSTYQSQYSPATSATPNLSASHPQQATSQQGLNKQQQNKKEEKKNKPQATRPASVSSKVLYLEANSDECFFQFYEQKRDTSKFVAYVIPGDMVATFEVIDVERIRSLNTSRSIKQAGNVAIKDAQGIKEQQAGKIHKTTDDKGTEYWVIDEPVTVEFKK